MAGVAGLHATVNALKLAAAARGGCSIDAERSSCHFPIRSTLYKANDTKSSGADAEPHPAGMSSCHSPIERSRWARFKYRQFGKRQASYVWVDLDRHPDPETAWSAVLEHPDSPFFGWCDTWEPADPPQPRDWLEGIAGLFAHVEVEVEVKSPPLVPDATLDKALAALSWLD